MCAARVLLNAQTVHLQLYAWPVCLDITYTEVAVCKAVLILTSSTLILDPVLHAATLATCAKPTAV